MRKMAEKTGISWTDSTLNLAVGCTKISDECKNCLPSKTYLICNGNKIDISEIKINDMVMGYDHLTGKIRYTKVINISRRKVKIEDILKISIGNTQSVFLTKEHPLYEIKKGYTQANNLKKGDELFFLPRLLQKFISNGVKITDINKSIIDGRHRLNVLNGYLEVFNIQTETENYFIRRGESPYVLSHNCYMYRDMGRYKQFDPYKVTLTKAGKDKSIMRNLIKKSGQKIFVNSWSDTFHKDISDATIYNWFQVFQEFPDKQFQILTKRPEIAYKYFMGYEVPYNCWIGTSIGIKKSLSRMNYIKGISAKIRFISFEPLLEDLGELDLTGISWVIIGGESDLVAPRPMKPEWAESIIKQAKEQGVAVWFKQMGGKGKGGAGGNLLNGRKIEEFPKC